MIFERASFLRFGRHDIIGQLRPARQAYEFKQVDILALLMSENVDLAMEDEGGAKPSKFYEGGDGVLRFPPSVVPIRQQRALHRSSLIRFIARVFPDPLLVECPRTHEEIRSRAVCLFEKSRLCEKCQCSLPV